EYQSPRCESPARPTARRAPSPSNPGRRYQLRSDGKSSRPSRLQRRCFASSSSYQVALVLHQRTASARRKWDPCATCRPCSADNTQKGPSYNSSAALEPEKANRASISRWHYGLTPDDLEQKPPPFPPSCDTGEDSDRPIVARRRAADYSGGSPTGLLGLP